MKERKQEVKKNMKNIRRGNVKLMKEKVRVLPKPKPRPKAKAKAKVLQSQRERRGRAKQMWGQQPCQQ